MKFGDIITRVRATCPSFATVGHALQPPARMIFPAAMIMPLKTVATPSKYLGMHNQTHTMLFGVYVLTEKSVDLPNGSGAQDQFDDLVAELHAALINWLPSGENAAPFDYVGGSIDRFTDGAFAWREEFSTTFPVRTP